MARELEKLATQTSLALRREFDALEKELGGRPALIHALAHGPQDRQGRYLLGLLADPDNTNRSLSEIAATAKMLPGQIAELITRGLTVTTTVAAKIAIARGAGAVVTDTMKQGAPHEEPCAACQGTGSLTPDPTPDDPNPSPGPCVTCQGSGRLLYPADPDARKLALDLAGLLPKAGGISITNSNTLQQATVHTGAERLQEAMDLVLFGGNAHGPVLDTEARDVP